MRGTTVRTARFALDLRVLRDECFSQDLRDSMRQMGH
jgi:hypothetical protein